MQKQAKEIINGTITVTTEAKEQMYREMKKVQRFNLARKILTELIQIDPQSEEYIKQLALCTYKDPDLAQDIKFNKALKILEKLGDLREIKDVETLGLLGAIYKKKWRVDNRLQHLIRSQIYYGRGSKIWFEQKESPSEIAKQDFFDDDGYCAVNHAFVMELIASITFQQGYEIKGEDILLETQVVINKAIKIRERLIAVLSPIIAKTAADYAKGSPVEQQKINQRLYWMYSTIGECYVGIRNYGAAKTIYESAKNLIDKSRWEFFSTAKQITALAQIQRVIYKDDPTLNHKIKETLGAFLGDDILVQAVARGKLGLALSGGGFRASFFHIGVLAYLAEKDVLRYVEALSCVSGGSLIGAYYYLKIKNLLESKTQVALSQKDYLILVEEIQRDFFTAVTENLRVKLFSNFSTIVKMIWSSKHTRSKRIADLYNNYLYQPLLAHINKFKRQADGTIPQVEMTDLFIFPKGESDFHIKDHNWLLPFKVPNLILNATTLNTGHNWQFTASWMGEPPGSIIKEVDAKYRLRRLYYDQNPEKPIKVALATAVAASSCVPGIFEPLVLENIYPEKTVRLVDGGVHDNQGVAGLIEQECKIIIVSDASGQLRPDDASSSAPLSVLSRTNNIFMERIRESQYLDLSSRVEGAQLSGLMFLHLWKDLNERPLSWSEEKDPWKPPYPPEGNHYDEVDTDYGIPKEIQKLLAGIRTDLDAFNEKEAFALMHSGYKMAQGEYGKTISKFFPEPKLSKTELPDWDFLAIENHIADTEKLKGLRKQLKISQRIFLKLFKLSKRTAILMVTVLALAIILPLYYFGAHFYFLAFAILILITFVFRNFFVGIFAGMFRLFWILIAFLLSNFSLGFLNHRYIKKGKIKKEEEHQA
ncbi:MAG: patatin-like phospholipase family protein [Saprospiraceae bacterium]